MEVLSGKLSTHTLFGLQHLTRFIWPMQIPQCQLATWQVHITCLLLQWHCTRHCKPRQTDRNTLATYISMPCRHVLSGLQPGLCMQASLDGLIALTEGCNEGFLQWAFYPANGASAALNHTATGLCMYPAGAPSALWSHAVDVIAHADTKMPALGLLQDC